MIRVNDETISKIGVTRRRLNNGLLQIICRKELSLQFKLFGQLLDRWCAGKKVTFMPIMHGAGYTWQRLMRYISEESRHRERVVVAQSYGDGQTQVPVKVYDDWVIPEKDITNRHLVLIDDILDSGDTAGEVIRIMQKHQPASIQCFFMVRKDRPRSTPVQPSWVMFDIDDCWIVGAGLDDCGKFRHLPYIAEKPRHLGID